MPTKAKPDKAALQKLKQDLKGNTLGQLYVFHGEEAYLRDFYLGEMKKKLLPGGMEAFNLHTPGREEVSTETAGSDAPAKKASVKNAAEVQCVIDGLGGKENILSVDNCFTRLRVNIKNPAKLDEASINKLPNSGIVKKGTDIQIVYGLQVADIKRAVEAQLENQ